MVVNIIRVEGEGVPCPAGRRGSVQESARVAGGAGSGGMKGRGERVSEAEGWKDNGMKGRKK